MIEEGVEAAGVGQGAQLPVEVGAVVESQGCSDAVDRALGDLARESGGLLSLCHRRLPLGCHLRPLSPSRKSTAVAPQETAKKPTHPCLPSLLESPTLPKPSCPQ